MINIKLTNSKDLLITENDPIYRGDNLNQRIIYLLPKVVDDIDILSATIYLNYIRADGCPDIVELERLEEQYDATHLQYVLPVTCKISKYAGAICTWMQVYSGATESPTILKSGECILRVRESKDMDDYIGDRHITALYQLKKQMETGFDDIGAEIDVLVSEKADDLVFHEEDSTIQLLANGEPAGSRIFVMLKLGLIFGFILGVLSIFKQYMGVLACYTAVFAPIGTLGGIVLNSVVKKSQAENTFRGKGIKYAQAEAAGFVEADNSESPVI